MVSDGHFWPKGVGETRLGSGVGSEMSSDKCSFIYLIIFLVNFSAAVIFYHPF